MARLNKVRVTLKHHGGHPSAATINQIVEDTAIFFAANTQLVFGVDYDQVSMADLIEQEKVRDLVRVAETAAAGGDQVKAMIALSDACDLLLTPRRTGNDEATSPLRFGDSISIRRSHSVDELLRGLRPLRNDRGIDIDAHHRRDAAEQLHKVTEIVMELQAAGGDNRRPVGPLPVPVDHRPLLVAEVPDRRHTVGELRGKRRLGDRVDLVRAHVGPAQRVGIAVAAQMGVGVDETGKQRGARR